MRTPELQAADENNPEMDDTDTYIQAVENFEPKQEPLSEELEKFITYIAKTGDILAPWEKVQKVFMNKLELVLDEFYTMLPYKTGSVNANSVNDDFEEMKKRLLQLAEEFDSPPFTIQRLCELLSDPRRNYTKCDKFMRGLEKNLMVVSSWNYLPRRSFENNDRVNGMVGASNGYMPISDRHKPHWANLPPSPVSTTPPKIPGMPDFSTVTVQQPDSTVASEEPDEKQTEEGKGVSEPQESEVKVQSSSEEVESKQSDESDSDSSSTSSLSKRKLEESEDPEAQHLDTSIENESPTKRTKQDEGEESTKEEDDSVKKSEDVTSSTDSAGENVMTSSDMPMSDVDSSKIVSNPECHESDKLKDVETEGSEKSGNLTEINDDSAKSEERTESNDETSKMDVD